MLALSQSSLTLFYSEKLYIHPEKNIFSKSLLHFKNISGPHQMQNNIELPNLKRAKEGGMAALALSSSMADSDHFLVFFRSGKAHPCATAHHPKMGRFLIYQ